MIIQFWLGAILLLIVASAIFLIPFLTKLKGEDDDSIDKRNRLNRSLYDLRVEEIEKEELLREGSNKGKLIKELQYNLLDDITEQKTAMASIRPPKKLLWLPGLLLLIAGSIAMYGSVGAYQQVDDWQQTLQRYPVLQGKLFNGDHNPTEQDLRDIMLGLRTHLASEPTDAQGWLLYSRLGMVFKDSVIAFAAAQKAFLLNPKSVDIVLVYAQLKMQKGDQYEQRQAELLVERLLVDNPRELQAWSMYAFMALEREDYDAAIRRWESMLTLPELSVKQATMLRDSIRYANEQLNKNTVEFDVGIAETQRVVQTSQPEPINLTTDEMGAPIYTVTISLAENIPMPDTGFIVVYAQTVSGSKMPIAAVKLSLDKFPISTYLADENAMVEGGKLSDHSEFIVKARLSKSGDVMSSTDDLQGLSEVIKKGRKATINITLTQLH